MNQYEIGDRVDDIVLIDILEEEARPANFLDKICNVGVVVLFENQNKLAFFPCESNEVDEYGFIFAIEWAKSGNGILPCYQEYAEEIGLYYNETFSHQKFKYEKN